MCDTAAFAQQVLRQALAQVDECLHRMYLDETVRWSRVDQQAPGVIKAVAHLVESDGGRLAPALCLSGYLASGGPPGASPVRAAAALELLQASCRLDALVGDLALVYADRLAADLPQLAGRVWYDLRTELIMSRYLGLSKGAYHQPLVLGATIAGRDDLCAPLTEYGTALGQAFQLRDDLSGSERPTMERYVGDLVERARRAVSGLRLAPGWREQLVEMAESVTVPVN